MRCRRFSKARIATSVLLAALLAGCAGGGGTTSGARSPAPARGEAAAPDAGAIAAMPDISEAALTRYGQAVFLLESGDQTGAEAELERFVAQYPDFPAPYTNLAIIYEAQGRDGEARAALQQALTIDPAYAPALNQLGILHRKNGEFDEAEAAYLKAVTVKPDYALAHLNLGILNDLYRGRLEAALSSYQSYQALLAEEDPEVARWIVDLSRRTGLQ